MPDRTPSPITTNTRVGQDIDLEYDDVRLADGTRLTNQTAERSDELASPVLRCRACFTPENPATERR